MRRVKTTIACIALALAIPACKNGPTAADIAIDGPSAIAKHTIEDDRAMLRAELLYKGVRLGIQGLLQLGMLDAEGQAKALRIHKKAQYTLGLAREAYAVFNSNSLLLAVSRMEAIDLEFQDLRTNGTNV
jgi:hypothetical protein